MDQRSKEHLPKKIGMRPPTLPSNIRENTVFKVIPDLFTGEVDGSQNHDNETGFFTRISEAGLTLDKERFFLEEISSKSFSRERTRVTNFEILSEIDEIKVQTEDGRELSLKVRRYRAVDFPIGGSPIRDLDSIRIFTLSDDINKFLFFSIVTPQQSPETN